jgi:hypothetical protein
MADEFDLTQDKSAGDLGKEAVWFFLHTVIAALICIGVVAAIGYFLHPDPDAINPKLLGTGLVFLVPMIGGFVIAKLRQDQIARYIWISGLLMFSAVCVWVIDLPTGNGLCEACANDLPQKLFRTFFDIRHGSGLMGGDGLLIGTWIPMSMIAYSVGARFGLDAV